MRRVRDLSYLHNDDIILHIAWNTTNTLCLKNNTTFTTDIKIFAKNHDNVFREQREKYI